MYLVTWINKQYEDTYELFPTRSSALDFYERNKPNCYKVYYVEEITDDEL